MTYIALLWFWLCGYNVGHFHAGDRVPDSIVSLARCKMTGKWRFGLDHWVAYNKQRALFYNRDPDGNEIEIEYAVGCNFDKSVFVFESTNLRNWLKDETPQL